MHAYALFTPGCDGSNLKAGMPKKSILMSSFNLDVDTPFDKGHAAVTQARVWSPCTAKLIVDAATYALYNALITKDKAGSKPLTVEFGFYRAPQTTQGIYGKGESEPYYKITLRDAYIINLHFVMEDVRVQSTGTGGGMLSEFLEVGIIFREIEGVYTDGNKSFNDKWNQ